MELTSKKTSKNKTAYRSPIIDVADDAEDTHDTNIPLQSLEKQNFMNSSGDQREIDRWVTLSESSLKRLSMLVTR